MTSHEFYSEDGSPERRSCPECGDAFLADHGDRLHCGKCSYTEWR